MVCLVEWILGRIEKKKKWEGKLFGGCLVEREKGKEMVELGCFLLKSTKKFSPKNGEKTEGRVFV